MTAPSPPYQPSAVPRSRAGHRVAGFGLIALGVAPLVVIIGGVILLGFLMVQTVSIVTGKVATVAAIATRDIEPEIAELQDAYGRLATQTGAMKAQLGGALGTLAKLEDFKIDKGQFGEAGGQKLTIPERDISVGPVKIDQGKLFDKNLPSVAVPPSQIALPMAPLRAAFAPLGPDGPLGKAIGEAEGAIGSTLGEVEKLKKPLLDIRNTVLTIPGPLRGTLERLGLIVGVGGTVVAALVLVWFIVALMFIRRRWGTEASVSYRSGGVPGLLMYGQRTMLSAGFSLMRGKVPPPSLEKELLNLRCMIEDAYRQIQEMRY